MKESWQSLQEVRPPRWGRKASLIKTRCSSQVADKTETGDSTGNKPPVEPQQPGAPTATGGGDAEDHDPLGFGKRSPPPKNVEAMDTTPAHDDTKHESGGDDSAQDSDEEKGPGGAVTCTRIPHWIKHYPDLVATTYAGTRIPHWLVKPTIQSLHSHWLPTVH